MVEDWNRTKCFSETFLKVQTNNSNRQLPISQIKTTMSFATTMGDKQGQVNIKSDTVKKRSIKTKEQHM